MPEIRKRYDKLAHSPAGRLERNTATKGRVLKRALVDDYMDPYSVRKQRDEQGLHNLSRIRQVIEDNLHDERDADVMMEMLPDMTRVFDILVSSILSPKDLTKVTLDIAGNRNVPAGFNEAIREYFTTTCNLENELPSILLDSLCKYGSKLFVPLPTTAIAKFISGDSDSDKVTPALEAAGFTQGVDRDLDRAKVRRIGILKQPLTSDDGYVIEEFNFSNIFPDDKTAVKEQIDANFKRTAGISITDNATILAVPLLKQLKKTFKTQSVLGQAYALEGVTIAGADNRDRRGFNPYPRQLQQILDINGIKDIGATDVPIDDERDAPLLLDFKHSAVIPVFQPGEPSKHHGYLIALDSDGNPVSSINTLSYFDDLNRRLQRQGNPGNTAYSTTATDISSNSGIGANDYIKPIIQKYTSLIEKQIVESFDDGADSVSVSAPESFYKLLLARQLKNQKTQLLYIPAEMATYVAFDYNHLGMGRSLLEKTKVYGSLRTILMFAEVMNSVKNSVGIRKLKIRLDEFDTDKMGTIETVISEYMSMQTDQLPIVKLNPGDMIDSLRKAGVQVEIDGGEYFPGTGFDVEDVNRQIHTGEDTIKDLLRRLQYNGCYTTPEQVDASYEGEFATGVEARNLLQAKVVLMLQSTLTPFIADIIKKYIRCGGPLYRKLRDIYTMEFGNKKGVPTFSELVNDITVRLPAPDTAVITAQMESFNNYSNFLDAVLPNYIETDALREMVADTEVSENLEAVREAIKAELLRQYIRRENMLPELEVLVSGTDNDGIGAMISSHYKGLFDLLADLYVSQATDSKYAAKRINEAKEALANVGGGTADNSDNSDEDPTDETGDSSGKGDDFTDFSSDNDTDELSDTGTDDGGEENGVDDTEADKEESKPPKEDAESGPE